MLRKGGGTFCLLSCVRINKQNRQSLNNISQMLENITEKPPKIILESFFLQVPGWDFRDSLYISLHICSIISYILLPELRLRYPDTARAGCQVGTIVWSLSNIRPHNPNKHTSEHVSIFWYFSNKLKYFDIQGNIWNYLEYFESCNIP